MSPPADIKQTSASAEVRRLVQQLRSNRSVSIGKAQVRSSPSLLKSYEHSQFQPLWADAHLANDLNAIIADVARDGLNPRHYHASILLASDSNRSLSAAQLDLLRTDALIRVMHDLTVGKTSPAPAAVDVTQLLAARRLREAIQAVRPQHFVYRGLVSALATLRAIENRGGWPFLPGGAPLARDSVNQRVTLLRQRLSIEGYDALPTSTAENRYDAALESAVRLFQHRHGLNEDGIVGPSTRGALNVTVRARIDQIRVNLERTRRIAHPLPDTLITVNIAGAKVYMLHGHDVLFEERAIVGKNYTRSPIFAATLQHIEANPTWTVPPGIVGEILTLVRRDRAYLARVGMRVVDAQGRVRDPGSINFYRYTGKTFPFHFVQAAGPHNPLGRIKFVFPNRYNVYLHDTPSRELFEQETRTFSHGCIRVREPIRLAELILKDSPTLLSKLHQALDAGSTTRIQLKQPIRVLILYWTASTDLHGELHFYADVYGRDPAALDALNQP